MSRLTKRVNSSSSTISKFSGQIHSLFLKLARLRLQPTIKTMIKMHVKKSAIMYYHFMRVGDNSKTFKKQSVYFSIYNIVTDILYFYQTRECQRQLNFSYHSNLYLCRQP